MADQGTPDAEYDALVRQLDKTTGKTDAASIAERMKLQKQLSDILIARRRSDRFQCSIKVALRDPGTEAAATVTNIGAGGAFLKTTAKPKKFSSVHMEIKSAGRLPLGLVYELEVRWVKDGDGLGVAFKNPGPKEAEALRRLLSDLVKEQPPQRP